MNEMQSNPNLLIGSVTDQKNIGSIKSQTFIEKYAKSCPTGLSTPSPHNKDLKALLRRLRQGPVVMRLEVGSPNLIVAMYFFTDERA